MSHRHRWLEPTLLVLILAVGSYARTEAVEDYIQDRPDPFERLVGDEPGYQYLAERWAYGESLDWPARMPLYPAFVGAVYSLFGVDPDAALHVQAWLGVATLLLCFVLMRRYHGRHVALLGAAALSLYPGLVTTATRLHTENLYIPLLLLVAASLFELAARPSVRAAVVVGVACALSVYCRPTGALLFAVVPALGAIKGWSWKLNLKLTAVVATVLAVSIVPWTLHNWRTYGVVHPLTTSIGTLWQGSPEYYDLMKSGRGYLDIWGTELNAQANGGHDPSRWEGDRYFTTRAIDSIRERPLTYAWYSFQKMFYYWAGHPTADWAPLEWMSTSERLQWIVVYLWAPICFVAAWPVRKRLLVDFAPYVLVAAYFTLVHCVLWAEIRLAVPLHPLLAAVASASLVKLAGDVRARQSSHS